jgi:hypothetical protein
MRFGVEEASGYEPVPVRAVTEVDAIARKAMERKAPNLPSILGLFNTTAVLLPEMTRYTHGGMLHMTARGTTVLQLRNPFPRAWLVRETRRVDGSRRALAAIASLDFDPSRTAIVSDASGLGDEVAPSATATVMATASRGGGLRLEADSGNSPAYLVVSETWYPGWQATVDDRPVAVERANHAFRGVALAPGRHSIEMSYRPAAFRVGLYLTLCSLAFITAGLAFGASRRSQTGSRGAG